MNKERLLKLADHMEKYVQQNTYDQDFWLDGQDFVTEVIDGREFLVYKEGFCGSAGCIIGHAAFIQEFKDAGLRLRKTGNSWIPYFNGNVGFEAPALLFNISFDQAETLFGSSDEAAGVFYEDNFTTQNVAKRLREFVENPELADEAHKKYFGEADYYE